MANLGVVAILIAVSRWNLLHAAELCLQGDFDEQFSYILQRETMSEERLQELIGICQHLETLLNKLWPGTVVMHYGSLATGLALKASDVDCVAAVPHADTASRRSFVIATSELFRQHPDVYQDLELFSSGPLAMMSYHHAPAHSIVDLSFEEPTYVEDGRLFNYYVLLDSRIRPITLFVKFWSEVHEISGTRIFPNYGMESLAIFYFQQKGILPPGYLLQKDAEPKFMGDWNYGFQELPYRNNNTESTYELLRGFFKYYSEFNFEDDVISTYAGHPFAKDSFRDLNNVPEEFVLYKENVKNGKSEPADFGCTICILSAFEHNSFNDIQRNRRLLSKLMSHLRRALKAFEELPREDVLRAILVRHPRSGRSMINNKYVDTVSARRDCNNAV